MADSPYVPAAVFIGRNGVVAVEQSVAELHLVSYEPDAPSRRAILIIHARATSPDSNRLIKLRTVCLLRMIVELQLFST